METRAHHQLFWRFFLNRNIYAVDHEQLLGSIKNLLEVHVQNLNDKLEKQNIDLKDRIVDLKNDIKTDVRQLEQKIDKITSDTISLTTRVAVVETKSKSISSFFGALAGIISAILTRLLGA